MHKLTVPLQSLSNHWFLYRVNSVIGIGVGAGAYILSRFAVSPHPDESIYISTHLLFTFFEYLLRVLFLSSSPSHL